MRTLDQKIYRRTFLKSMAAATAGILLPSSKADSYDALGTLLPTRALGNTGENITLLGVGGYHVGWAREVDAQAVIETAIEGGIRFFDTAHNYWDGESERRYGKYLVPRYRDQIFLMSKSEAKTYKQAMEELDLTLKRLGTDHLDLWQLHALRSPNDVDMRIEGGVLRAVEEALNQGKIRHAGFTGHASPAAHEHMLKRSSTLGLFSTVLMPVNVVDAYSENSFIASVLEPARKQKLGVLAMKTLADGRFFAFKDMPKRRVWETKQSVIPNVMTAEKAMQFAWSLPVSVVITGAENAAMLKEKIQYARQLEALRDEDRATLIMQASQANIDTRTEYYKTKI